MATPVGGRSLVEEPPSSSSIIQDHIHDEALAMIEALIDFPPEAGTPTSAAWKERIATLLRLVQREEPAHPHARGRGAPPTQMLQR